MPKTGKDKAQSKSIYIEWKDFDETSSKGYTYLLASWRTLRRSLLWKAKSLWRNSNCHIAITGIFLSRQMNGTDDGIGKKSRHIMRSTKPLSWVKLGEAVIPTVKNGGIGEIGEKKDPVLNGIPARILELVVKSRSNMLAELFEACMSEKIFPVSWTQLKLILRLVNLS